MVVASGSVKYLALVLALAAVIAIAGCIGGGGQKNLFSMGKDALSLSIDAEGVTTFDSLQPFTITLNAENTGSFDATNASGRLQGFGGLTARTSGERLSLEKAMSPKNLDRPQPDKKIAGGTGTVEWEVSAPYVAVDAPDAEIVLTGEVFYTTKSLASQRIVAATQTYIKNAEARGEQIAAIPITDSINGPVAVDVEAAIPYVKVLGEPQTDFRIKIMLNNDGSGTLYNRGLNLYDYLDKIIVKLPAGIGVDTSNCDLQLISTSGIDSIKTLVIDNTHSREKLRLLEGGVTRNLNCHLYADSSYVTGYNTFDLKIEAFYTYIQQVTKRLLIKGTEEKPLKLHILKPLATAPEFWVKDSVHTVKFEVLYQNMPVKSGIAIANMNAYVGSDEAQKIDLNFDTTDNTWGMRIKTPNLGAAKALYDLKVQAGYGGETAYDIQRGAVNYSVLVPY